MSNPLRLVRADIQGFRRLGRPLAINFENGPGITILVGPNGSGKSTVIDSIEWVLTGTASRLPQSGSPASRRTDIFRTIGSSDDPIVTLTFEETLTGKQFAIGRDSGPEEISSLLRNAEQPWRDLKSIDLALQWTHFSSQRSVARLGYDNGEAIMKTFAGPAGLERLRGLDQRLWGRETKSELRRQRAEAADAVRKHSLAFDHIQRLQAVMSAQESVRGERRLAELIASLSGEPELDLSGLKNDSRKFERVLLDHRSVLESRLSEVRQLSAERRDAAARARRLEVEAEASRQMQQASVQLAQRRADALAAAEEEVAAIATMIARMADQRSVLLEKLHSREEAAELDARKGSLDNRLVDLALELGGIENRLAAVGTLEELAVRIRAGQSIAEMRKYEETLAEFGDPEKIEAEAKVRVDDLARRREALREERATARNTLSRETERMETLRSLAVALADHLTDHDSSCPVCAATYDKGELMKRASVSIKEAGPAARELTRQLNEKTQELGSVAGELQFFTSQLEQARIHLAQRERFRVDMDQHSTAFGGVWSEEAQNRLEARVADLRDEFEIEEDTSLRHIRVWIEERRRRAVEARIEIVAELEDIAERRAALAGSETSPEHYLEVRAQQRVLDLELERENSRLAEARTEHRAALELVEEAGQNVARAANLANADQERAVEERRRFKIIDRELRRIFGAGDEADYVQSLQKRTVQMGAALERLAIIRSEDDRAAQSAQADHEMKLLGSSYMPANARVNGTELHRIIHEAVVAAEARVKAIDALETRLRERARHRRDIDSRMHGTVLRPWNSLFKQVYSILAGSLGETLEWTPDQVDMRVSEPDAHAVPRVDDQPLHGWYPGHFFSEGQLAALQISAMITASVLLPWSRWQALILDDPLQHADVIKVGAFADLMRSLCQDKGHQIIMTTHDQTQAEFIRAKFFAAGLSAKVVQFQRSKRQLARDLES